MVSKVNNPSDLSNLSNSNRASSPSMANLSRVSPNNRHQGRCRGCRVARETDFPRFALDNRAKFRLIWTHGYEK